MRTLLDSVLVHGIPSAEGIKERVRRGHPGKLPDQGLGEYMRPAWRPGVRAQDGSRDRPCGLVRILTGGPILGIWRALKSSELQHADWESIRRIMAGGNCTSCSAMGST